MKRKCRFVNYDWQKAGCRWQFLAVSAWLLTLAFSSCNYFSKPQPETAVHTPATLYTCPMHPEIKDNKPGICPKCKMFLVPDTAEKIGHVMENANSSVISSIKTTKPVFKKINPTIDADGYIDYDDRTKNNISSLVSGRIEKLYVRYNYQHIHKGEKVFEIYSPELVSAQENLIYILNNSPDEKQLLQAAKQKLNLLGFTEEMIQEVASSRKSMRSVPVFSKYEGHVHEFIQKKPEGSSMPSAESEKELSVKEGQYVMMGQTVFDIVNENNVSIVLQIKAEDIQKIHKGQDVEIFSEGGIKMHGNVDFIEPFLKKDSKTMTVRVYAGNEKHEYRIGALVKAAVKGASMESLWVPQGSVVDLGTEKIVWIKQTGNFVSKKVSAGISMNNMVEIKNGLSENDEIALEAHYLADSEEFIKTNEHGK